MNTPVFYLGAHHPAWLGTAGVPLFVSRRQLVGRRGFPRAVSPWALDSGGFSELSLHGQWTISAEQYAGEVRRFRDEIGQLAWAAPQDWMCEADMLKKTGLTIEEHQRRTVANYLELKSIASDLPWLPVLQGWTLGHYLDCVQLYEREGIDLARLPLVGIGTVCRRQHTMSAQHIIRHLADDGLRLHGFGFKVQGLRSVADVLASADSMAWSYQARRRPPLPECSGHKNCANCQRYALEWRDDLLSSLERQQDQLSFQLGMTECS